MGKNEEVLEWMKKTDLVEVAYKQGDNGFTFSLGGSPAPLPRAGAPLTIPSASTVPVTSPAVGFYHAASPGKSKSFKAGDRVEKGGSLGFLEAGPKRWDIKSPESGTIEQILIEEGQPAQYGQPLFMLKSS